MKCLAYCGRTFTVGPPNTPNIHRQNHISMCIETLSLRYQSFLKQLLAAPRTVDGCHTHSGTQTPRETNCHSHAHYNQLGTELINVAINFRVFPPPPPILHTHQVVMTSVSQFIASYLLYSATVSSVTS